MSGRWKALVGLGLLLLLVGAVTGVGGYYFMDPAPKPVEVPAIAVDPAVVEADPAKVQKLCTYCHEYAPPDSFPKHAWHEEMTRAWHFIRRSDIKIDQYPNMESVIRYYENQAPAEFPTLQKLPPASRPFACTFKGQAYSPKDLKTQAPGVTNVNLVNLFDAKKKDILMCHTRPGEIWLLQPYTNPPAWRLLGKCVAPVHAEVVDLDGDGIKDLIVADVGSLFPSDDKAGRVLWFRGDAKGNFNPITLLEGIGRTVDVQAANFMGHKDGKLDLVVAVFGWHTTGEIRLLENHTTDWSKPKFVSKTLDDRPGAIHVLVTDLNSDGKPDFVACISQATERIVAFINDGAGGFQMEDVFIGPHPGWGFSGIQLVDMNNDGKLDVLYSNGDILDPPYIVKPYHGVQWLENPGKDNKGNLQFPWKQQRIDGMNGTMRAYATDLDSDGDQDIVAVSFMPPYRFPQRKPQKMDAVIILEQTAPGKFERHGLEIISADHVTCIAGDLLGDGNTHFVVGNFFISPEANQLTESLTIWWNQGKKTGKK